MEEHCTTGQRLQRAVVPMEEEEEEKNKKMMMMMMMGILMPETC
jgi:hypothetical protein